MENKAPENIAELEKLASDRRSHENRLRAIEELGKFNCIESKRILLRLMNKDLLHRVQHRAFLKLQAFGESVKLPKGKKGHLIEGINKKLGVVLRSIGGEYSEEEFNKKFKELYPEAYDVYKCDRGTKFNQWVNNVLTSLPKEKVQK